MPAGPVRADVAVLCPGYRDRLEADLSGLVERFGIEGDVRVQIVVRGSEIEDVRTVSGPREYHAAVRSAVRRFHCRVTGSDAPRTATLTVTFRQD